MRRIILYIAVSLDGYIADSRGGVDWISGDGSEPDRPGSYEAFYRTIDTVILGRSTWHQITTELSPGQWPYPDKQCYVLTHEQRPSGERICFTDRPLPVLIAELREQPVGDIWICGGASVVRQLMERDLIDRYWFTVIPVLLGDGIPLFDRREGKLPLILCATDTANGMVDLVYERIREAHH